MRPGGRVVGEVVGPGTFFLVPIGIGFRAADVRGLTDLVHGHGVAVRQVGLREAAKLGFSKAVIPRANAPKTPIEGLRMVAVDRLADALRAVLSDDVD